MDEGRAHTPHAELKHNAPNARYGWMPTTAKYVCVRTVRERCRGADERRACAHEYDITMYGVTQCLTLLVVDWAGILWFDERQLRPAGTEPACLQSKGVGRSLQWRGCC